MPADYISTARALSLPLSPSSPNSAMSPSDMASPGTPSAHSPAPMPPWARSSPRRPTRASTRRLSTPYSRNNDHLPLGRRIMQASLSAMNQTLRLFMSLTPAQRVSAVLAAAVLITLSALFLAYSHRIFAWLEPIAVGWRELPAGWLIMFLMTTLTAFPPMMGYSSTLTIAGFVWGFPGGWPVVAAATVFGSTMAFLASRTMLSSYVNSLVGSDKRFMALGQVLRHDGVMVLAAIRLCPLPFSLSNGFLATIPSVSPVTFAIATAIASPKLMIHVFIGSRLAKLAENGGEMTFGDKAINYLSMILGAVLGGVIGLVIYRRTTARAEELMREEATENGDDIAASGIGNYEDLEEGLTSGGAARRFGAAGEGDAAALMDDDDISLWETDAVAMPIDDVDAYRDDVTDTDRRSSRGSGRGGIDADADGELPRPDVFDV